MNLIAFSVNSTNVFPISNSNAGGQLLTEYNLRAREGVLTDTSVEYPIGQSYTHSERDFEVTLETDGSGVVTNSSAIQISAGRAIVNGHYVESLVPITIDLVECNAALSAEGKPILSGNLCVGLRIMYSTSATMSGAMLVEDQTTGMYEGIQIVILPKEGLLGERFTLPSDSPTDESKVNAHLKLAEFQFQNGSVLNINANPDKYKVMSADRLSDVASFISDTYITKTGLNAQRLYTFAGKGTDPSTGLDTWCDSTDSLMVWDQHPAITSTTGISSATFLYDSVSDTVRLQIPHKQVDGMEDTSGNPLYYKDKILEIPSANYALGTGGTVTKAYTDSINAIDLKVQSLYQLPSGSLKYYYEGVLTDTQNLPTPDIGWKVGDYVLVDQDGTLSDIDWGDLRTNAQWQEAIRQYQVQNGKFPTTLYFVVPGIVRRIQPYCAEDMDPMSLPTNEDLKPESVTHGIEIARTHLPSDVENPITETGLVDDAFGIGDNDYRGVPRNDYFTAIWTDPNGTDHYCYYLVTSVYRDRQYGKPVILTPRIPLATESMIGGFFNVDKDAASGGGYVYRDNNGYLRIVDYDLLLSGVLAYQLGHDLEIARDTTEVIQSILDQHVNQRVCFPDSEQILNVTRYNADNTSTQKVVNHIHLYINLPNIDTDNDPEEQELNIYDIDSRFSSSLHIHLIGGSRYNVVNIINCEKVKIYVEDGGSPKINLYKSCVYYDTAMIDYFTVIQDMKLWYEKFSEDDPDIQVNGMTVEMIGQPEVQTVEEFWNSATPNDNHYSYAVRSITFGPDGTVVGLGMLVTDNVTGNIADGSYVYACSFTLPQSQSLPYPPRRMNKTLKVAGNFVTAYPLNVNTPEGYKIKNNSFTAMTTPYTSGDTEVSGTISFLTHIESVTNVAGINPTSFIDGWDSNHYYIFYGGAVD